MSKIFIIDMCKQSKDNIKVWKDNTFGNHFQYQLTYIV